MGIQAVQTQWRESKSDIYSDIKSSVHTVSNCSLFPIVAYHYIIGYIWYLSVTVSDSVSVIAMKHQCSHSITVNMPV